MSILSAVLFSLQKIKWQIEAIFVSGEAKAVLPNMKGVSLFIIPHADDELLSSWKTITTNNKSCLYYCGLTGSNDKTENKKIRDGEIAAFASDRGISLIVPNDWKQSLVETINNLEVDCVFLPSYIDWHPEHRLINEVLVSQKSQLKRNLNLFWYSVSVPIQSKDSVIVPMNKEEVSKKYCDFVKYYQSQNNMPIQRFMIQDKISAKRLHMYSGEVYLKVSFELIQKAIQEIDTAKLNELKLEINNITKIRKRSRLEYIELRDVE